MRACCGALRCDALSFVLLVLCYAVRCVHEAAVAPTQVTITDNFTVSLQKRLELTPASVPHVSILRTVVDVRVTTLRRPCMW